MPVGIAVEGARQRGKRERRGRIGAAPLSGQEITARMGVGVTTLTRAAQIAAGTIPGHGPGCRAWAANGCDEHTTWRRIARSTQRLCIAIDQRTFLSEGAGLGTRARMNKRDRFIAELRKTAQSRGLSFKVETWRGKGGHAMVWVGDRVATIPGREIDPKTARKIKKALGLD